MSVRSIAFLFFPLVLAACGGSENMTNESAVLNESDANITTIGEDNDSLSMADDADQAATAAWVGRWTGPEGLFLDIRPAAGGAAGAFTLTIKDTLDTQGTYAGTAEHERISFERNGRKEAIRPGTGAETGFKYLADKQNCLIIQPGKEGYCR